jgi:hypothetical protein
MIAFLSLFVPVLVSPFKTRARVEAGIILLRHLNVLRRKISLSLAQNICVGSRLSMPNFYNNTRTHRSTRICPASGLVQRLGQVVARPILGGLHHEHCRI